MLALWAILRPRPFGHSPYSLGHWPALPATAYKLSLDPLLSNQGLRVSKTLSIKLFPLFLFPPLHLPVIPPCPIQSGQSRYITVFFSTFSRLKMHIISLPLIKITCTAQLLNEVMLPTGILVVSETFVTIQSILPSGFYSQDRHYFAQYSYRTLSDESFYLKKKGQN